MLQAAPHSCSLCACDHAADFVIVIRKGLTFKPVPLHQVRVQLLPDSGFREVGPGC